MDKLIISETDRGRYAVRPMNWAGIWNEKGQIKESLNHLALFIEKEDAEKFVEWKEAEEQGKLLKLPCAVGDTVYYADNEYYFTILPVKVDEISIMESSAILYKCLLFDGNGDVETQFDFDKDDFGKTVFLTREEAEAALKELRDKKG